MPKKKVVIGIIILMGVIGILCAYATVFISDPFYSLPSIPITLGAFFVAVILLFSLIRSWKRGAGFYLCIYALALLISTGFAVVAEDYSVQQITRTADQRIMCQACIDSINHVDQELIQFSLTVECMNYYYSEISLNNIEFDLYYINITGEKNLALHDRCLAKMILKPKEGNRVSTTVSIVNPEIVAKIYEQAVVRKEQVLTEFRGSVWFDTKDGLLKRDSVCSRNFTWNQP